MNEQLEQLIALQELCTKLDRFRAKQEKLPREIEAAEQSGQRVKSEYEKMTARYDDLCRERKQKEIDLVAQEEKLVKLKSRTTEIKTNKEYHALLAEIEAAKGVKGDLEEALLLLMDQVDQVKVEVDERKKLVEAEEKQAAAEQKRLEDELASIGDGLKQVEEKLKEAEGRLPSRLLKEFHHLRSLRGGLAVVAVKDGACQGCRLAVPPQLYADVRKNEKVLSCTYCQRFLYFSNAALQAQSTP